MDSEAFFHTLAQIYGADRLLTQPAQLAPYESDALTAFKARPRAVVLAETQQEVIDTVRLCHRAQVPFVARGSGTSLSGGSLPVETGIVIALNRLKRILRLDPQQRLAMVEPGVVNLDVSRAAASFGLYYAPDPSSQPVCTIGGNVAFNSGGAHCLKYGMTSNHVLGLKVVLPDGEVVELGGESLEGTGPDWPGLFVGSEGLFGIALEITLRLLPKPEAYQTVLAAYDSLEAAGQAVARIVAAGLLPGAMEIMDRLAIQAAEAAVQAGYPAGAAAVLIVELEGEVVQVEPEFAELMQVIEASGASEVRVAQDEADRARIWKGRKSAFSAVGRLSPDYIVQDGVVPRSRLGEALAEVKRLGTAYELRVANVFHAGDGNLHPLILYDGRREGQLERAEVLAGEILRMCIRLGGTITGEHGIGMEKRQFLPELFDADTMAALRRLRSCIDPAQLANPGKMLVAGARLSPPEAMFLPFPAKGPGRAGASAAPATPADVQAAVRAEPRLLPRGGGSKPALSTPPAGTAVLDLSNLRGVLEYEPEEYTLTALAGTPLQQVENLLAEHGQYLPFDPVLVERGATLGGTLAAGLSGPGRYRYGGVRDFLLGIRFVDGAGRLVRGGGQVVKNAAGFDLPKLLVGSLGRLGVLVEVTFKVFPKPAAYGTLRVDFPDLTGALAALYRLSGAPLDLEALDFEPPGRLWVRLAGRPEALPVRLQRLQDLVGTGETDYGSDEQGLWRGVRELEWIEPGSSLVKVPLTPGRIADLELAVSGPGPPRRYSAAGNLAWLGWPDELDRLDSILSRLDLGGLVLLGPPGKPLLGVRRGGAFGERVKQALDPNGRFGEL